MKKIYLITLITLITNSLLNAQNWSIYNVAITSSNEAIGLSNILSMDIDGSDNLWFAVPRYGLVKYDRTNWTNYNSSNSGIPDATILFIKVETNGIIWIGTEGGGLVKFDGTDWKIYNTTNSDLPHNVVTSIAIDETGNKWIGTGNGLAKFDNTNWTIYNTSNLPSPYIKVVTIDGNNNKWIGTLDGLAKFDDTNYTIYNTSNTALIDDHILSITIDNSGNKWIGTWGSGMAMFDGTNWTTYETNNSNIPDYRINSIAIDENENKWVGTGDGGIGKFDGTNWTIYDRSNTALPDNNVRSLIIDKNNTKWIGTFGGLASYNENGIMPLIDDDNDGVINDNDTCPETPAGESVDQNGCAQSQLDDDNDGVMNNLDLCPNTIAGTDVNENGCFFLPSDNFSIEVIGETCSGKNNGELSITANETHSYTATINNVSHNFTNNNLIVSNLIPGSYTVCISVTGETFEQCYTIVIAEGKKVLGKAIVKSNKASIAMEQGTAPYNVYINGISVLNTLSPSFTLEVKHGDLLEVKTAKSCEGKFSKSIDLFEDITVYPNPSKDIFEITLPISEKEIAIELYTMNAQLISKGTYKVVNGKVQINLENKSSGMYIVKIYLDTPVNLTIIKE